MAYDTFDEPDLSMISRRGHGVLLVSADTATEIARRVHKECYGADDLLKNEPLKVAEKGNHWIVTGFKEPSAFQAGRAPDGPLIMKISKFDGQILSYALGLRLSGLG